MNFLKFAIFAMAFVGAMASCGAHQVATEGNSTAPNPVAVPEVQQVNHVAKIAQSFGAWTSLKANGSVSIGGKSSLSSSMHMLMEYLHLRSPYGHYGGGAPHYQGRYAFGD